LDDGGGEHARQERPAVGVKAEQDHVAAAHGREQVDVVPRRLVAPEEVGDVWFGQDREPVAGAG
jgi:hypothetical protein